MTSDRQFQFKSINYTGLQAGPRVIIMGATHGNETCGTVAIRRVMEEIDSGRLQIVAGSVTFVPIVNPKAYEQVTRNGDDWTHVESGEPVTAGRVEKMSKSKKNVVDPDSIIDRYGADEVRWFMQSDSPPERDLEWSIAGIEGAARGMGSGSA